MVQAVQPHGSSPGSVQIVLQPKNKFQLFQWFHRVSGSKRTESRSFCERNIAAGTRSQSQTGMSHEATGDTPDGKSACGGKRTGYISFERPTVFVLNAFCVEGFPRTARRSRLDLLVQQRAKQGLLTRLQAVHGFAVEAGIDSAKPFSTRCASRCARRNRSKALVYRRENEL